MKGFFSTTAGRVILVILFVLVIGGIVLVFGRKGKDGKVDASGKGTSQQASNTSSKVDDSYEQEGRVISDKILEEEAEKNRIEDVKEYYEANASVVEVIKATESAKVMTEAEVTTNLQQRGFQTLPITYEYDMNGNEAGSNWEGEAVNSQSQERHPMYETIYEAENGMVWVIYSVNGEVAAVPVSYNWDSDKEAEVIVSESERVVTYDPDENRFIVTEPKKEAAFVIVVPKVDADTINKLTREEIDKRWK